jgi:hypothetical protein
MTERGTTTGEGPQLLRRYTDLTAAIDLLTKRRLTLLDPATWDDRNDSYFLRYYKERSDNSAVLALCLSTVGETYHHWRVFCGHASGVCIEFYKQPLLDALREQAGVRHGPVSYRTLDKIAEKPPTLSRLPFLKRYAFRHEWEYRVIFASKTAECSTHSLPIDLDVLHGVTLSPWMPPALLESMRQLLRSIPGCEAVPISRSELISNKRWMENADRALRGEPLLDLAHDAPSQ